MSSPSPRAPFAWIVVAHLVGAAMLGAIESLRLGSASLALVLVPLFAATGLVAGGVIAATTRLVHGRPWWLAALGLAAPSLLVTVPMARTLFEGAYAQTLPLAGALPYLLPLALWLGVAAAVAAGRRIARATDLTTRALIILACAGAIGAIVWVERNILRSGYPSAHAAATIALIVLVGCIARATRRTTISAYLAAGLAAIAIGTAFAATVYGLTSTTDRRRLASYGEHARDLVHIVRGFVDRDGDGASPLLGGGDCDDHDPTRFAGAGDKPGDGIDQDCDGADAVPAAAAAAPAKTDLESWRASPEVRAVLDRSKDFSVLLVTVDALREDILRETTPDRAEFPRLTKLFDESVWFTRAIAPGAGTDICIGTLLTGRHDPFQPTMTTLPEALRELGRVTSAALPVEVTRYVGETLLARGFDRKDAVHTDWDQQDVGDHVSAQVTTDKGIAALAAAGGKLSFVWVHYFDVHEHHQIDVPKALRAQVSTTGGDKRHTYRALLRAIDDQIGRLLDELAARGLADKTIIVFASDHGESLGEDPRLGATHGKVTYAALTRVPLAFKIPGVPGGRRTDTISLVDLPPTLLGLLGAPTAMSPLDGVDMLPALLDAPAALRTAVRPVVIHEELQWSVVEWPHQLIVQPADGTTELYDLEADGAQTTDLSEQRTDVVARLRAHYAEHPQVKIDRTTAGRRWREGQAKPPK